MPRKKSQAPPPEDEDDLALIPDPVDDGGPPPGPSYYDQQRLRKVVAELATRSCEGLKLYEPLPIIEKFHADRRDERLLRGSNRAGKTLGAAVEFARAVTGQDPHGKYPLENGRAFAIGLDGEHVGGVMYRKLFRAGAFKMIRDQETGQWRAYRPGSDRHRESECKPAPPLIPGRFIKEIAWEEKKRSIPRKVTLHNGWEINFFSSKAACPNGVDIDLWWIDEELENDGWYEELVARVLDRHGKGYWSATPQVAAQQLYDLHLRAEAGDPNVGEHVALLEDNPHIDQSEKDKLYAKYASEEVRRVRIQGEFALTGFKVYPEFSMAVHGYDMDGPIPADWTCYAAVDPGRQICATLFLAVPPPSAKMPFDVLLYDELYIKSSDAAKFGVMMKSKEGAQEFEALLIDSHASRVTEMGSGRNVEAQFSEALKKNGVKAVRTGHGFIWGADDPDAGILKVRDWFRVQGDGKTRLRVARGRLPSFEHEAKHYRYQRINKLVSDKPEKKNDHLMDCLRYLAMFEPVYAKPKPRKAPPSEAVRAMKAKLERRKKRDGGSGGIRLGPGKAA